MGQFFTSYPADSLTEFSQHHPLIIPTLWMRSPTLRAATVFLDGRSSGVAALVLFHEKDPCVFSNFFFQQNLLNMWNYLLYSKPWGCPLASDRLYVVQVDQLFPGVPINGLGWRIASFGSAGSATPSKSGSSLISSTHLSTFWSPWSFEGGESNCKFNFPTFSSDGYWVCSV